MIRRKRICVVTGSRADYGLLYWVMRTIQTDPALELQIVVTGSHLSSQFGMTIDQILNDGLVPDRRVEMLLASDTPGGIAKSMSIGLAGLSDAMEQLQPDIVVVLGDRFEIFVAAQAAMVHNIPIAHIAGGDVTEGAFDEAIRHAITKMAHVHLVTNKLSAHRVASMGEDPSHVHVVGSPGLDHLRRTPLMSVADLEASLGAALGEENLLISFHPVTLDGDYGRGQFEALLAALDTLPGGFVKWFTRPNADPGNIEIGTLLDKWAMNRPDVHVYTSLGQSRYLSLMARAGAVVGNSSSGLYEAPSLGVATVDIGDRQGGRLAARSVVRCAPERDAIAAALNIALNLDCTNVENPYGDGQSADRIVKILKDLPEKHLLLKKVFHEQERSGA